MMNKMCKNRKPLFELIFSNNTIVMQLGFWQENQGDAQLWADLQKYVINAALD